MVNIYLFDLALFLSILIHEIGHALAAILLRVPVLRFRYGFGPLLFRMGKFEWRLVPISGTVETQRSSPWTTIVIAVSGVMFQWAIVAIAMVTRVDQYAVSFWAWMLGLAIISTFNFIPVRASDGAVIWYAVGRKMYKS